MGETIFISDMELGTSGLNAAETKVHLLTLKAKADETDLLKADNRRLKFIAGETGDPAVDAVMKRALGGAVGDMKEALLRPGESASDSIVRRREEYLAKSALEGRRALPFAEWRQHDAVLNAPLYKSAETETAAPHLQRQRRLEKVLAEVDVLAENLRKSDSTLTVSAARTQVLSSDTNLSSRYRAALLDLPGEV